MDKVKLPAHKRDFEVISVGQFYSNLKNLLPGNYALVNHKTKKVVMLLKIFPQSELKYKHKIVIEGDFPGEEWEVE